MSFEKFTFERIAEMDGGRLREAINQAIRRSVADMQDRPGVKGLRKVKVEMCFEPVMDHATGELDCADFSMTICDTAPKKESKAYNMKAGRNGLFFNDLSPEDANQMTLDEIEGAKPKLEEGAAHAG